MMLRLWLFATRIAIAASYATLGACDPDKAGTLAWPFGLLVALVAIWDLATLRRA
jgi:hypothetical protein